MLGDRNATNHCARDAKGTNVLHDSVIMNRDTMVVRSASGSVGTVGLRQREVIGVQQGPTLVWHLSGPLPNANQ